MPSNKKRNKYKKNPVLLKIHRKFTQNESVNYLMQEISVLKQTVGILESEKSELEYINKQLSEENELLKSKKIEHISPEEIKSLVSSGLSSAPDPIKSTVTKTKKQWTQDEIVKEIDLQRHHAVEQKNLYKKEAIKWRDRFFNIQAKYEKDIKPLEKKIENDSQILDQPDEPDPAQ